MSRKNQLTKEYKYVLSRIRSGKSSNRNDNFNIMRSIVQDLIKVKSVPASWHYLTDKHIHELVAHWRNLGRSDSTIMNKLSALRKLNQHGKFNIPIPSSRHLGFLKKNNAGSKTKFIDYEQVSHPICKAMVQYGLLFGMTKTEVIKFDHCEQWYKDTIIITRQNAHNSKERLIPITNQAQINALKGFHQYLNGHDKLQSVLKLQDALALFRIEAKALNLDISPNLRYGYAISRYAVLRLSYSKNKAIKTIQQELGLSNTTVVKGWLA